MESWENYRQTRNNYVREVSNAKEQHEHHKYTYLINERNSTKKWWSIVKDIQSSNDAFESIPPIEVGGDIVTDDKDKATAFNDFFLEASTLDDSNAELPDDVMIFDAGLGTVDVTLKDVCDQLSCLDTSKSYGPDNISPRFLKEGGIMLAESLCRLYKMSLRLSKVPNLWKLANIVPIHKTESQNLRTNYDQYHFSVWLEKFLKELFLNMSSIFSKKTSLSQFINQAFCHVCQL